MGQEGPRGVYGLCNAVMLSAPNSAFVRRPPAAPFDPGSQGARARARAAMPAASASCRRPPKAAASRRRLWISHYGEAFDPAIWSMHSVGPPPDPMRSERRVRLTTTTKLVRDTFVGTGREPERACAGGDAGQASLDPRTSLPTAPLAGTRRPSPHRHPLPKLDLAWAGNARGSKRRAALGAGARPHVLLPPLGQDRPHVCPARAPARPHGAGRF
jgi:hypothetical protein